MIEVYVDNHDNPNLITETVKRLGDYEIEHADDVSCIIVPNVSTANSLAMLDILFVRNRDATNRSGIAC